MTAVADTKLVWNLLFSHRDVNHRIPLVQEIIVTVVESIPLACPADHSVLALLAERKLGRESRWLAQRKLRLWP